MSARLENLLQNPALWRTGRATGHRSSVVPSGFAALDAQLPGGGWPNPALIEVLNERPGIGELSLFLPALRSLCLRDRASTIAWLNPPHLPYPPALAEQGLARMNQLVSKPLTATRTLWAMEQALRSEACAAVLAWMDAANMHALRRLKLAANAGRCFGLLFRSPRQRALPSPATVRLLLSMDEAMLVVELVKVQGGRAATVRLGMK
jgi:cell division inhibitor SulA/protein ImuA